MDHGLVVYHQFPSFEGAVVILTRTVIRVVVVVGLVGIVVAGCEASKTPQAGSPSASSPAGETSAGLPLDKDTPLDTGALDVAQAAYTAYTLVIVPMYPLTVDLIDQVNANSPKAKTTAGQLAAQLRQVDAKLAPTQFPADGKRPIAAFRARSRAVLKGIAAMERTNSSAGRCQLAQHLTGLNSDIGSIGISLHVVPIEATS